MSDSAQASTTRTRQRVLLAAALAIILSVALGLRLYGLDWDRGYGYTPHPDERAILGKVDQLSLPALDEVFLLLDAEESPLNPRWFNYGSLPLYMLKGVQIASSAWNGDELRDLRLAGRAISALADVGTVIVVYLLGASLYGRREGLLAAALVALAVIHIQLSHFFAVDTLLVFFTVTALYFLYRVAREGRLRDSLLAGGFIGLGLGTKVSIAPIYIAFVMAHLLFLFSVTGARTTLPAHVVSRWRTALAGLALGASASVVVFTAVQPYMFLDWARSYGDVTELSEAVVRRIRDYPFTRQYIDTTPYWYHVRQLATWGLGWPLGVVAWAGLLYASLRGMALKGGLVYLAAGWGLPMAVLLYSGSFLAVFVASGVAFAALVGTLPFRSRESRGAVLLLSWVAPYFLITGAFQVKFLRYLLPMTPVLLLFGSGMLIATWDRATDRLPSLRPWLAAGGLLLIASTAFYALSYMAIYAQPHTAVRSAAWINENAPKGSVILMEHWEEGLPDLAGYKVRVLPLYDDDTSNKLGSLSRDLAEADYVVFFSNRLYGTIPRLPDRYPATSAYYRLLFSGELGYELANAETAYPRLAGVSFTDDTFGRPGLPRPTAADSVNGFGFALNLGFADESFSVYDHPLGLVFRNVERLDAESIRRAIEGAVGEGVPLETQRGRTVGLLLPPEEAAAQQRGGTWSEIVDVGSWANRLPILAWLALIEGVSLLAIPVSFVLFWPLADRGYLLAKALGLLMVCLTVWLLASLQWVAFSRGSFVIALLLLGAVSLVTAARHRQELVDFVRRRWRVILAGEVLFLLAFFAFVAVRMANPDLWHPHRGGEKPMELAYLNAVLRSTYMPPYDPWFGGGYLNYYYWGQFIVATLIKATGIEPRVAFNLAVPTFFALTVAGAFSLVYNLAEGTRRKLNDSMFSWSPVVAGVAGGLFVAVIGNLDGAIQLGHGLWRAVFRSLPFGEFDFWRSSRMMPPDPPGFEITEFPFFTFLFADLHPNMMSIPFTLLALGLALATVLAVRHRGGRRASPPAHGWSLDELARLATLGVVVGAIRVINTWDYPTYLIVAGGAVLLAAYLRNGGLSIAVLLESAFKSLLVFAVGYLIFLPFHLNYETFFTSLERTTNQTVLWQFLGISGLFVFIVGSYFVYELRDWLAPVWRVAGRWTGFRAPAPSRSPGSAILGADRYRVVLRMSAVVAAAITVGYVVSVVLAGWTGSTVPFLAVMVTVVLVAGARVLLSSRGDAPHVAFVAMIVGLSLALAIGLDIFRVEGDIERMNSVFKFYLQIWVMLALASAYLLWRLAYGRRVSLWRLAWGKKVWLAGLVVLIASASVYTVMGAQDRLRDRFNGRVLPLTLDGTAYIHDAVYRDPEKGEIKLSWDNGGIEWLQDKVEGSPIILEGYAPEYRWGARISVYTGLPGVIGWANHQRQQRASYAWAVDQRIRDVNRIYRTDDSSEALALLREYGVEYVYVGQLERLYYPATGIDKFEGELSEHLESVYQNEQVTIYRVLPG